MEGKMHASDYLIEEATIHEGIADLDHGRSIGEDEMRAFWKRCGVPASTA
jgi:predicted transcriptional regulator